MTNRREILQALQRSLVVRLGRPPHDDEFVSSMLENRLPLLSFDQVIESTSERGGTHSQDSWLRSLLQSESFKTALQQETKLYERVHRHFVAVAEAWKSRGVEWICFKSVGIEPAFPYTSDNFDILVRPADCDGARKELLDLGYVELPNVEEPQKWLFRLFAGGDSPSAIHLHTRVGWGQGFMIEPEIWRRRRISEDDRWTWVPGAEDSLLINLAHAVFENKELTLHDLMKVRYAIELGVDWEYINFVAVQRGWVNGLNVGLATVARLEEQLFESVSVPRERHDGLMQAVQNQRVTRRYSRDLAIKPPLLPQELPFAMSKRLFFDKLYADKQIPLGEKPLLTVLALARGFKGLIGAHPQNSALIALSGMDGSGKTAQALALADAFSIAELRAEVRWARFGATPLLYALSRLVRSRRRSRVTEEVGMGYRQGVTRRGLPLKLWAGLSAADYLLWLLQVRWRLLRGEIVIADRYLCDVDVELSQRLHEHPLFRTVILHVLKRAAADPQSAFLLRIDPHLAASRAVPDGGDIALSEQMRLYDALSDQYSLKMLDAAMPFDKLSAELTRDVLRVYLNHYGMVGNLLYFSNPWQLNRREKRPGTSETPDRFTEAVAL